jgi:hypothetical protein
MTCVVCALGCRDRAPEEPRFASQSPARPEREASRTAGVVLGSSRAEFQRACAAAGHEVDHFDWDHEAPIVRQWVDEGRASECSGALTPFDLGHVVQINATFMDDHLTAATLCLDTPREAIERRLESAYPTSRDVEGRRIFVVDARATGYALVSIGVGPSYIVNAQCSVTLVSRASVDAAPLP